MNAFNGLNTHRLMDGRTINLLDRDLLSHANKRIFMHVYTRNITYKWKYPHAYSNTYVQRFNIINIKFTLENVRLWLTRIQNISHHLVFISCKWKQLFWLEVNMKSHWLHLLTNTHLWSYSEWFITWLLADVTLPYTTCNKDTIFHSLINSLLNILFLWRLQFFRVCFFSNSLNNNRFNYHLKFELFLKEASYCHQRCIYLIENAVKTVKI